MSPEKVKNLVVIKCNHQALIKLVFSVIYQHIPVRLPLILEYNLIFEEQKLSFSFAP